MHSTTLKRPALFVPLLAICLCFACTAQTAAPIDEGAGGDGGGSDAGRQKDSGGGGEDDAGGPADTGHKDAGRDAGQGGDADHDGGPDGGAPCNGADLMIDPNNCGTCGKNCLPMATGDPGAYPTIAECVAGNCVVSVYKGCQDGRGDCDRTFDNGCEAWLSSDLANCGVCGLSCAIPNAAADCTFSTCVLVSCGAGYENCDLDLADGCEAHPVNDLDNCGRCGKACVFPHGAGACVNGKCTLTGCDPDWYDADKFPEDGCEYYCKPNAPKATEVCGDKEDNNCDGQLDEGCPQEACSAGDKIACGSDVGECVAGSFVCVAGHWDFSVCKGVVGPKLEECNNKDDDCSGAADDNLTKPCEAGDGSWCETTCGTGWWECKTGAWSKVPPPAGSAESCNGLDDDCNGKADDGFVTCPAGMANVGVCVCVDRWEASRPDATDKDEGRANGPPQSKAGVLPWRETSWTQADAACRAAGKRLCTAAEWKQACMGLANTKYPYGATYDATACNGADASPLNAKLKPAGSFPVCRSDYGVYDMSGNVEEWNSTSFPDGKKGLRGGSYNTGDTPFMRCDYDAPPSDPAFTSQQIGFRCCKDP